MARSSLRVLEVLLRRLKADEGLLRMPELWENLLSRCRALQRTGVQDGEQDQLVMSVLLRRDVLLAVDAVGPEAMNLRVRQSEQLNKLAGARRRNGWRGLEVPARKVRQVPMAGSSDEEQDEGEQEE